MQNRVPANELHFTSSERGQCAEGVGSKFGDHHHAQNGCCASGSCSGTLPNLIGPQYRASWRFRKVTQPCSVIRSLRETPHESIEQATQATEQARRHFTPEQKAQICLGTWSIKSRSASSATSSSSSPASFTTGTRSFSSARPEKRDALLELLLAPGLRFGRGQRLQKKGLRHRRDLGGVRAAKKELGERHHLSARRIAHPARAEGQRDSAAGRQGVGLASADQRETDRGREGTAPQCRPVSCWAAAHRRYSARRRGWGGGCGARAVMPAADETIAAVQRTTESATY